MAIIWNTDFETDQWNLTGTGANTWEYDADKGVPRTTDHVSAAISAGRSGTGRAVWLGDYNGHSTRNEIFRDRIIRTDEPTYIGVAIYIDEPVPSSRALLQCRNMKLASDPPTSTAAKNPFTLRQHPTKSDRLYFNLLTDPAVAEVVPQPNGASEGAESWPKTHIGGGYGFDYTVGEWIDIVIYWDALNYTNDNTLKIWINGVLIIDHFGVTNRRYMATGLEVSGDLKHNIGTYWASTNPPEGNAYYDDYKVCEGVSCIYQDVSPLGLSPIGAGATPIVILDGASVIELTVGDTYSELGATWTDVEDGSGAAIVSGDTIPIPTNSVTSYTKNYNYTDTDGNVATQVSRTINVSAAVSEDLINIKEFLLGSSKSSTAYVGSSKTITE